MKEEKYITVLDFEAGRIYQYNITETIEEIEESNLTNSEWYEEYIIDKGHKLSNCQWMIHDDPYIDRRWGREEDVYVKPYKTEL